MLPLYKTDTPHPEALATGMANHANLGLYFGRFFNWTVFDIAHSDHKDAKTRFLNSFYRPKFGNEQQIKRLVTRQMLLNKAMPSVSVVAKSDWHWVTGMGNSHPLENGFTWHHTLSMPYLPASSVKGLLRAFCEINDMPKAQLRQWFGSESKTPEQCEQDNQAGELIFFDAIPCTKADILPDVMTPHSGDWLEAGGKGETAPADWHEPIPIGFIAAKNVSLLFSVALASHSSLKPEVLNEVKHKLTLALGFFGAGAKTSTGYGTMSVDEDGMKKVQSLLNDRLEQLEQQHEQREQQRLVQSLSENERIIHELMQALDTEATKADAMKRIEDLANGGAALWSHEERCSLAQKLKDHEYSKIKNKVKSKARKAIIAKLETP